MESIMFRIMNMAELNRLEEENELLEDSQEKAVRAELIEQVMERIMDYDCHIHDYAYKQTVQAIIDRGVLLEPVERADIISMWDKQFDGLVSVAMKQAVEHYSSQFRWHLFSFELLPAMQGDDARQSFNSINKSELFLFFEYADECYRVKNANLLTAEDVETLSKFSSMNNADMYFYDPLKKWTYIKPHEDYCGPYFFKVD